MSNPEKLKKVAVVFKFTTVGGYSQTADFKSNRPDAVRPGTPEETLADAIDELCRVATLEGMDPVKIAQGAQQRTLAALEARKKGGKS